MDSRHRVVVIGGGFGGLHAVRSLKRAAAQVTLVDRRNFHLFQPLLYQVATGALSPANIAAPLRALLRHQKNARVLMAEVVDFDVAARRVLLDHGDLPYDTLVVATGASFNYFGHDDWQPLAPGLKSIEDATAIRARFLSAFEAAERETDQERRAPLLTFMIVGGGPTGVEMAGALAEVARYTLRKDFRGINPADARIILLEAQDRILTAYPEDLSQKAARSLARLGVEVRTRVTVTGVEPRGVTVKTANREEFLAGGTVLWTAGVKASSLGAKLAAATGAQTDRAGRVIVEPDLTVAGHPEIFVIGDLANFSHQTGKPLPGVAPVAMQQGRYVARAIAGRLRGEPSPAAFRYKDRGNMATIGRAAAVADLGWIRFSGYLAWLAWLFVHLMNLVQFQNRLLVLMQWAWSYATFNRSARLITETPPPKCY